MNIFLQIYIENWWLLRGLSILSVFFCLFYFSCRIQYLNCFSRSLFLIQISSESSYISYQFIQDYIQYTILTTTIFLFVTNIYYFTLSLSYSIKKKTKFISLVCLFFSHESNQIPLPLS